MRVNDNQELILREFDRRGSEDDKDVKSFADAILEQKVKYDPTFPKWLAL